MLVCPRSTNVSVTTVSVYGLPQTLVQLQTWNKETSMYQYINSGVEACKGYGCLVLAKYGITMRDLCIKIDGYLTLCVSHCLLLFVIRKAFHDCNLQYLVVCQPWREQELFSIVFYEPCSFELRLWCSCSCQLRICYQHSSTTQSYSVLCNVNRAKWVSAALIINSYMQVLRTVVSVAELQYLHAIDATDWNMKSAHKEYAVSGHRVGGVDSTGCQYLIPALWEEGLSIDFSVIRKPISCLATAWLYFWSTFYSYSQGNLEGVLSWSDWSTGIGASSDLRFSSSFLNIPTASLSMQ